MIDDYDDYDHDNEYEYDYLNLLNIVTKVNEWGKKSQYSDQDL